jgi:CubicO group peptidase (beta-lactamase class C family)
MKSAVAILAVATLAWTGPAAIAAAGPTFNASGPDAAGFGAAQNFPAGDRVTWNTTPFLVGSYSRYDTIFPSHRIVRASQPWNFQRAEREPEIHYKFGGKTLSLDDYLAHFPVTGILVLKGDTILLERYQYGRKDTDRFMSASMAKSVMSLLAGVALAEGKLHSLEDPAERYVPGLKGSLYGGTSLRALLQMSSGIEWDREVNGVKDNVNTQKVIDSMFEPKADPVALVAGRMHRAFPVDTHFDYSAGDNEAMGLVLKHATGKTLSDYCAEKIWGPIGAEADATWWADPSGLEFPASGYNAVLRDWARLGRLLAYDGAWNGKQIVPKDYVLAATSVRPADKHLQPGGPVPYYGYGYQIWTFAGPRRMFVFRGANSQYVFVDPASKLVFVQTAVFSEGADSVNGKSESLALWLALVKQFGAAAP